MKDQKHNLAQVHHRTACAVPLQWERKGASPPVPLSLAEQQRIAGCLSLLDAVLAGQSQKLAALKTHKQALMQQLFPSPEGD